ncbi:MAG: DUF3524 domain-containing protein [Motiliproteus sp.]
MKILLLSGYHAASHKYWTDGMVRALDEHQWHCLSLPARHFNWRIRGAPLSWLSEQSAVLEQDYELVIATSMVDLATLKGLVPSIARTPCLYYCHENQFEYPRNFRQHASVDAQMVNLYAALAADRVLFNSAFNRDSFFAGVNRLLNKLPDHQPATIEPLLADRCQILPVPLVIKNMAESLTDNLKASPHQAETPERVSQRWQCLADSNTVKILWAARWEYDKGPDRLLAVMQQLERCGTDYKLCILGEQFRRVPPQFETIERQFSHRLVQFGYAESREAYQGWLASADMVLSTSIHEFQGIAVLEAIAAGCVPILPSRLAYPELVAPQFLYASHIDDVEQEALAAVALIHSHQVQRTEAPAVDHFTWPQLRSQYAAVLAETVAGS